jgi:23S rRNA (adenine2503-C2)-methyltransferase
MRNEVNLFGCSPAELAEHLARSGQPAFRGGQLFQWMHRHGCMDFAQMTNLPLALRASLASAFRLESLDLHQRQQSSDGSVKYLFRLADGATIEAVYLEMNHGVTLCISSQVGCIQGCSFCLTARMGFVRNLSAAEMVGQVSAIRADRSLEPPFNVVMMGMGEPLLNLANTLRTLEILTHPQGYGLSAKRITVSTSGHVRNLLELGKLAKLPRIAISLNATTDELRDQLMPVNRQWKIAELIAACRSLPLGSGDRLTFEYVLLGGINDTTQDAKRLVSLLGDLSCRVNLIPFNATPELPYRQPDSASLEAFLAILERASLRATVRWSKGRDVGAACGQLATPFQGPSLSQRV